MASNSLAADCWGKQWTSAFCRCSLLCRPPASWWFALEWQHRWLTDSDIHASTTLHYLKYCHIRGHWREVVSRQHVDVQCLCRSQTQWSWGVAHLARAASTARPSRLPSLVRAHSSMAARHFLAASASRLCLTCDTVGKTRPPNPR